MTLDELKKLELPVKLMDISKNCLSAYREITVTSFNSTCLLIKDSNGEDGYLSICSLKYLKPKPKTVKVHLWLNVYENCIVCFKTKEEADKHIMSSLRLACEEFIREYEFE